MNERLQKTLLSEDEVIVCKPLFKNTSKQVFKTYSQGQEFLLPKSLEEEIDLGHVCRLINSIVDEMDLTEMYNKYKGGGTSAYDPRMLVKVWILGFVNKIYSSRFLAKALRENIPFMWISGKQHPDFRTLNNFRKSLGKEIKHLFKEIVVYGMQIGIISGKDLFIDHTKSEANANKHTMVWRKNVERISKNIDDELDTLFKHIDEVNKEEDKIFGDKDLPEKERNGFDKDKVKEIVNKINKRIKDERISRQKGAEMKKNVRRLSELLERKKSYASKKKILGERNSYSKTDIDAVAMMQKDKISVKPGYNEGIAVENGFVISYILDDNCADNKSFIPLMDEAITNLGKNPETATADSAYGNEENHAYLENKNIGNYLKFTLYHKEKSKKWLNAKIRFNDFKYNTENDEFTCKNNAKLVFEKELKEKTATGYIKTTRRYKIQTNQCTNCQYKNKCTESKVRSLTVCFNAERLKDITRTNLNSKKGIQLRKRRGNEVESIFGDKKSNQKNYRYLLRGIKKVNIETGLYYIAHNIRKILTYKKNNSPT